MQRSVRPKASARHLHHLSTNTKPRRHAATRHDAHGFRWRWRRCKWWWWWWGDNRVHGRSHPPGQLPYVLSNPEKYPLASQRELIREQRDVARESMAAHLPLASDVQSPSAMGVEMHGSPLEKRVDAGAMGFWVHLAGCGKPGMGNVRHWIPQRWFRRRRSVSQESVPSEFGEISQLRDVVKCIHTAGTHLWLKTPRLPDRKTLFSRQDHVRTLSIFHGFRRSGDFTWGNSHADTAATR
jgi:hypothetical protein